MTEPLVSLPLSEYNALVARAQLAAITSEVALREAQEFLDDVADKLNRLDLEPRVAGAILPALRTASKHWLGGRREMSPLPPTIEPPTYCADLPG